MNKYSHSHIGKPRAARLAVVAAALFGWTISIQPAQAGTFQFVIPTTTIQDALRADIESFPADPDAYAFYDIYIRPSLPGDPSYTRESAVSPKPSGPGAWSASTTDPYPYDMSHNYFRFTYLMGSTLAVVTTNTNINGKTIVENSNSYTLMQMPGSNTFQMLVTSSSPLFAQPVNFQVYGFAYEFLNLNADPLTFDTKEAIWSGSFSATGDQVPEPGSLLTLSGGSILLAVLLRRRKTASPSNLV